MNKGIEEIKKELDACEKLYYVGICILKENRILKRVLIELSKIYSGLVFLATNNKKFKSEEERIGFFIKNFAIKVLSKEDIKNFIEIIKFNKMHEESSLEFVRGEKVIIYYNGRYESITKEKIVKSLNIIKLLMKKISEE